MTYYKKKSKQFHTQSKVKQLFVKKSHRLFGCWRFMKSYERLDGVAIYREWACGEGEVVRHLCGDNRCIIPLHLIKGTDIENAEDEIKVRDYSIKVYEDMIGENYDDLDRTVAYLVLQARVSRHPKYAGWFKGMSDIALHARGEYRRNYELSIIKVFETKQLREELAKTIGVSEDLLYCMWENTKELFELIKVRNDIKIILA